MTPPFGTDILDSDPNQEAVPEVAPSARELSREADTPATEAFLLDRIGRHARGCSAAKQLRRWSKVACVLLGILLASQWWAYRASRSMLHEEMRPMVREEARAAFREELARLSVAQDDWKTRLPEAFASKGQNQ